MHRRRPAAHPRRRAAVASPAQGGAGPDPTPLPEPFRARFQGLEEQRLPTRPGDAFHDCFGCGPGHPAGLRVRCFRTADGVAAPILVPGQYAGPPGAAHGGIVAAYLDEVLGGAVARATGKGSVTGELTVRYLRPVPVETPVVGHGRVVADHGRYLEVEGRLERLDTGEVLATARARFFPVPAAPRGIG